MKNSTNKPLTETAFIEFMKLLVERLNYMSRNFSNLQDTQKELQKTQEKLIMGQKKLHANVKTLTQNQNKTLVRLTRVEESQETTNLRLTVIESNIDKLSHQKLDIKHSYKLEDRIQKLETDIKQVK